MRALGPFLRLLNNMTRGSSSSLLAAAPSPFKTSTSIVVKFPHQPSLHATLSFNPPSMEPNPSVNCFIPLFILLNEISIPNLQKSQLLNKGIDSACTKF
ncbi:unnamed protein product [Trifolium pratense]|uniref:Uncharacterized protein n=1 Tax=Trifolium pratense TaxID=57577 RepID=A0ACB0LVZ5_TRIPR|nr:unnamed protein product [Trifolium pratense]